MQDSTQTQETSSSFGSVSDLLQSIPVQTDTISQADTSTLSESFTVANSSEQDVVVVDNASAFASDPVTSTISEPLAATITQSKVEPKKDSLEAFLTEEIEKAKETPEDRVTTTNVLLDELKKLVNIEASKAVNNKLKDILGSVSIDVNNLDIISSSSDPLGMQKQLSAIEKVDASPAFPVIALKSGYRATFKALNNNEKIAARNFRGTKYDQTVKLLRLVYSKITESSLGNMSFDDFLKFTADEDFETLMYGIYYSTFPNAIEYNVTCPHCRTSNTLKLKPDVLIEIIDQENAGQYVQKVLNGYNKGREFLSESLVNNTNRTLLSNTKVVAELCTPSLRDMLDNLRLEDTYKGYEPELVNLLKYIKRLFIPNIEALSLGHAQFFELNSTQDMLSFLAKELNGPDMKELKVQIAKRINRYRLAYRIPSFACAAGGCKKMIDNIEVDLMRLVFTGIAEEEQL